jgi:hypothetical protein
VREPRLRCLRRRRRVLAGHRTREVTRPRSGVLGQRRGVQRAPAKACRAVSRAACRSAESSRLSPEPRTYSTGGRGGWTLLPRSPTAGPQDVSEESSSEWSQCVQNAPVVSDASA